ncbi:hypothetical protein TNCV_1072041 [Trichonephila clavipes]|nr:hypothetical protein TNCV_1072041 [Trichonephila clavipes]
MKCFSRDNYSCPVDLNPISMLLTQLQEETTVLSIEECCQYLMRLFFHLLVHRRYFISLLSPIGRSNEGVSLFALSRGYRFSRGGSESRDSDQLSTVTSEDANVVAKHTMF